MITTPSRVNMKCSPTLTVLFSLIFAHVANGQQLVALSTGADEFRESFSRVTQAVVLRDGRLIVLDDLDQKVKLVDFAKTVAQSVLRSGSGPGEIQIPGKFLIASPDGGVVVVDRTNSSRIVHINADARTVSDWPRAPNSCITPSRDWRPLTFRFLDDQARFYRDLPPISTSGTKREVAATAPIVAFRYGCASDTVAAIPIRNRADLVVGINGVFPKDATQPFSGSPQWVHSPTGNIVIVEVNPYQVTTRGADGKSITRVIKYQPVSLSAADKAAWREAKNVKQPATVMRRDKSPSSVTMAVSPWVEPKSWPRYLPPFADNALVAGGDGSVWIRRSTSAGAPALYDVVSAKGEFAARVSMAAEWRVIAVNREFVYYTRTDGDGLQWLRRTANTISNAN